MSCPSFTSRRMQVLIACLALGAACNTRVPVDYEGLQCSATDPCPSEFSCISGSCQKAPTCGAECSQSCGTNGACSTPPPAACLDASTLRTFGVGSCTSGRCSYASNDSACAQGCVNGACALDPACSGVECASPPPPSCFDASTLRTYDVTGACAAGQCSYVSVGHACAHGCEQNRCKDQDLCGGVTCNQPPRSTCSGGKVQTFGASGSCDPGTGACTYTPLESSCNGVCSNNYCVPPARVFNQVGPGVRHAVTAVDQAPSQFGGHVLAVGPGGKVSKWNGTSWSVLASSTTEDLASVWLESASSGWIVGDNSTVLRYNGTALTPVTLSGGPSSGAKLVAVHGVGGNHVLIADESGNYWRYDGNAWSHGSLDIANTPYKISSAFVAVNGVERLAGQCTVSTQGRGCVAVANSLNSAFFTDDDSASGAFLALGPSLDSLSLNTAFAGTATGAAVRRHLTTTGTFDATTVPSPLDGAAVVGIAEAPISNRGRAVYVLTAHGLSSVGRLYRYTPLGFDPPQPLFDAYLNGAQSLSRNDSGGVVVADSGSASATLIHRGYLSPAPKVLDLGEDWTAAAYSPSGELMLMNSYGDLAIRGNVGFSFRRSTSAHPMYAMVVGSTYALTVGSQGDAYRFSKVGGFTKVSPAVTAANLRALCRVSDTEVYAVGDSGTVLAFNGTQFTAVTPSPTQAHLAAVACIGAQQAVAVGKGGTVLRLSNGSWSPLSPAYPRPNQDLTSVWEGAGVLYVAGDGVFSKLEAGVWTSLPALPHLNHLQGQGPAAIYADSNDLSVVRFDGAAWTQVFTSPSVLKASALDSGSGQLAFVGSSGVRVEGQ